MNGINNNTNITPETIFLKTYLQADIRRTKNLKIEC